MKLTELQPGKMFDRTLTLLLAAAVLRPAAAGDMTRVTELDRETGLRGADYWAGRPRHPAVVNAVGRTDDGTWLSLAGEWRFTNMPHGCGLRTTRFKQAVARPGDRFYGPFTPGWTGGRTIRVPGCWEAQGVGGEGMGTSHLCQDNAPKMVRGNWLGECYYVREVAVPAAWKGKRVWMKVGGIRNRGWIYVDNRAVALTDAYAGAWKYEITDLVKPGRTARVVVVADNVVGARNAQPSATQRWGGIVRDIELEATPETFIDDAWVRGDFDRRLAKVHVEIEKIGGENRWTVEGLILRATVENEVAEIPLSNLQPSTSNLQPPTFNLQPSTSNLQPLTFNLKLPLRSFRPWSPESPNLYTAKVELVERIAGAGADLARRRGGAEKVLQTRFERFGVRKLEVRGTRFFLNNRPFYFRGFGDDSVYPITGITPPSREYHLEHFRRARAAWLARFGLTHAWGDRLQDAQHALQAFWQKDGVEHARKDPHCGGICFWTIADVSVRNEKTENVTAQGLLDAFWNEKSGGRTLAGFARFNSPSCLLLDTQDRVRDFTGSDAVDASWWIPGRPEETNRVYAAGGT